MKKQIMILLFVSLIVFSTQPIQLNNASTQAPLQKIAIIIDSPEFYHSSFVDDILNAFSVINTTYQIDYDVFQLTDYSLVSTNPYHISYMFNGSETNHTALIRDLLIPREEYDLFVVIGYELRRSFLDFVDFSEENFLFYDLSGEFPAFNSPEIPTNLFVISFQDNEAAFLAGSLAVAKFYPLPNKIAIVGTYGGNTNQAADDPRSRRMIAGFQSAIFRNNTNVDIQIHYVNSFVDSGEVQNIASNLNSQGIGMVFAALQANNTLELSSNFSGGPVISLDINTTPSVLKNNSKVFTEIFSEFNKSNGFFGGVAASYGLSDNIFHTNGWNDAYLVNKTIVELVEDVSSNGLIIPNEIVIASNTPGYSFLIVLVSMSIISLLIGRKKRTKKN